MATFIPANVEVPFEGLENGSIVNDDGHGWAVASKSKGLQVGKSMNFYDAVEGLLQARIDHGPDSLALFHSRYATHGTTDINNVHPFFVPGTNNETVMAHNGVLPSHWYPELGDKRSDTRVFADRTAPGYLTQYGVPSRRGAREIGRRIGTGNKLVFLSVASGTPKVRIVNALSGQHSGGVWYSNDGYTPCKYNFRKWNTGTYSGRWWDDDIYPGRDVANVRVGGALALPAAQTEAHVYYENSPCEVCGERGTVNMDTAVCVICSTCQDCWNDETLCTCKWRKYMKQDALDEDSIWTQEEIASGAFEPEDQSTEEERLAKAAAILGIKDWR